MIKTGTKIQGVDTESKLQIDVLDLAEKLQLLPKDEAAKDKVRNMEKVF